MVKTKMSTTTERATAAAALAQKRFLNVPEVAIYTGYSQGYVYNLMSKGKLPFTKPGGKTAFFEREKIDEYMRGNLVIL